MLNNQYVIQIIDRYGNVIDSITDFISMSLSDEINKASSWKIRSKTKYRSPFTKINNGGGFIVVYRNNVQIYIGIYESLTENYNNKNGFWDWEASGNSFVSILGRRCIYPTSLNNNQEFTQRYYNFRCESDVAIRYLIDDNIGVNAGATRHLIFLNATRSLIGNATTTDQRYYRLDNLFDVCVEIAKIDDIVIMPQYDQTTKKFTFYLYSGNDVSNKVIFMPEMGDVTQFSHTITMPKYTNVLSQYNSDQYSSYGGSDLLWQYLGDAMIPETSGFYRIELLDNPESGDFGGSINAQNIRDYAQAAAPNYTYYPDSYAIELCDLSYSYGYDMENDAFIPDYRLGDTIAIYIDKEKYAGKIVKINFDVSYGKETIVPTLGSVAPGKFDKVLTDIKNTKRSTQKNNTTAEV